MNGLAVMLCVSVLGVQQTWRTTQEGQLEYVLQVEPTFLASLEQGETITSKLPATAKEVHRLCLRISAGDLKKVPQRTPELPPLASAAERAAQREPDIPVAIIVDAQGRSEETTDVSHGWQVQSDHRVQYLVQLSPDLLGKLREGDEIYINIYPEAGQIQQFVVLAGQNVLPRKSEKEHRHSPLAAKEKRLVAPAAAENPTVYGPMAAEPSATSPRSFGPRTAEGRNEPRSFEPRAGEPPRLRNPPRYTVADEGTEQPLEQPFAGELAGQSQYGDVADNRGPAAAPELFTTNPAEETTAAEQPEPAPLYGPARSAPPRTVGSEAPVFDRSQFDQSQFASAPVNRPKTTRASLTPPDDGNPYAPEEETRLSQPRAKFGAGDNTINNVANVETTSAEDERAEVDNNQTASVESPKGRTGLGKGAPKSPKSLAAAATDGGEAKPPYWPLFFTCCALFLSIGGNLYLGWTAAEFYSRYRLTVERMRSSGREADRD